jgi:Fe2+ transport system protein FeoA
MFEKIFRRKHHGIERGRNQEKFDECANPRDCHENAKKKIFHTIKNILTDARSRDCREKCQEKDFSESQKSFGECTRPGNCHGRHPGGGFFQSKRFGDCGGHRHHHHHGHGRQSLDNLRSLSIIPAGEYIFVTTLCSHEMEHRLLEMGFVQGEKIKLIERTGNENDSSVVVEIKGSRLALSSKMANDILVKEI